MARKIVDFSTWKKIYEKADYKVKLSGGEKIKLFKIDQSSFKVKIVSQVDIVGADGKISPQNWNMLKSQYLMDTRITAAYPALKDLKNNIVIYSVDRGSGGADRVELFTFTVAPRTSAPGVDPALEYIKKEDIGAVVTDPKKATVLTQSAQAAESKPVEQKEVAPAKTEPAVKPKFEPGDTIKLKKPLSFDTIKTYSEESPIFSLVDSAYFKLKKNPRIAALPFMASLKSELKSGQLGDSAVLLFKGIIAGYNLKDKYDDPLENVSQEVIDKLQQMTAISERASSKFLVSRRLFEKEIELADSSETPSSKGGSTSGPSGFNIDAFIKAVGGEAKSSSQAATSGIKLPDGGLVKGKVPAKDPTLAEVQRLIIKVGKPLLAGDPVFDKFVRYGGDGNYGPTTTTVIKRLEQGLKDSLKLTGDGTVITQELVDLISGGLKLTESYLDLSGMLYEQVKFDLKASGFNPTQTSSGGSREARETSGADRTSNKPPAPAPTEISQRTVDTALKNESAAEAYLKILEALMGYTEDEDAVIDAIENHIQTKQDWIDLETLWGASKFSIDRMQGNFSDLGLDSIDDLPKYLKSRLESTDTTSPQLKTLMKALKHYFSGSQMAEIAEVLPEGVSIRTEKEASSGSELASQRPGFAGPKL